MNPNRKTATIVDVLYIIGTAAGILSLVFLGNTLSDSSYLIKASENQNQIVTASLLVLTMGFSLAMMSVVLFPILKKHNEALALGVVLFRGALEAVFYIAIVISWLLLLISCKSQLNIMFLSARVLLLRFGSGTSGLQ